MSARRKRKAERKKEREKERKAELTAERRALRKRAVPLSLTVTPFAFGSFSLIGNILEEPDSVIKHPKKRNPLSSHMLHVESAVLEHLECHSRIVRYQGQTTRPQGIKLGKEPNGNLRKWIENHTSVDLVLKLKWCVQAAEDVAYIHSKNVLHCDLRPAHFLISKSFDLRLCDFGGSRFGELYGRGRPNVGFFYPNDDGPVSDATDIFTLGSCMYTIMTGHHPHGKKQKQNESYKKDVNDLLLQRIFPNVQDVVIGDIISACWDTHITAEDVLARLNTAIFG